MRLFYTKWFGILLIASLIALKAFGGIKIAVMDTGLNMNDERFKSHLCPSGHKDFTSFGLTDTDGHGTHVVGLITKHAGEGDYCLIILKWYSEKLSSSANELNEESAIKEAIALHADIINLSGGGTELSEIELADLQLAGDKILLIGAAGNNGRRERYYPGCAGLSNTRCVGALNGDGTRAAFSNYGPWVDVWEPGVSIYSTLPNGHGCMSGTSMATAIATGKEIHKRLGHKAQ